MRIRTLAGLAILAGLVACATPQAPEWLLEKAATGFGTNETFEFVYVRSRGQLVDDAAPKLDLANDVARQLVRIQAEGLNAAVGGESPRYTATTVESALAIVGPGTLRGMRVVVVGDLADRARIGAAVERTGATFGFVSQTPADLPRRALPNACLGPRRTELPCSTRTACPTPG